MPSRTIYMFSFSLVQQLNYMDYALYDSLTNMERTSLIEDDSLDSAIALVSRVLAMRKHHQSVDSKSYMIRTILESRQ